MSEFSIRAFKSGEEENIAALWERCDLIRPWNNPLEDIEIANKTQTTEIFVGEKDGQIMASVLVGFDGHRGWIYYLAVSPEQQGAGYGRAMMRAAEIFLLKLDCPKVELMIRPENHRIREVYESCGYEFEDRTLMVRWLKKPQDLPIEEPTQAIEDQLPVMITYLEMTSAPKSAPRPLPVQNSPVSLVKLKDCTVSFYRHLYNTIGEKWMWWEKRIATNEEIHSIVTRDTTDQYLLSVGGVPAGWAQLDNLGDFEGKGQTMEVGYFGLFPDFLGRGLGPYLLDFAIQTAWAHPSKPSRVQLNTCTLDHPSALPTYQKSGFSPYKQELEMITDPRKTGVIPNQIELAQPLPKRT